ncbi:MAG: Tex family protein [Saprospiraceae bacterium]
MEKTEFIRLIANSLGLTTSSVKNTIQMLDEESTIPFISRYRKEATGGLDEVNIADIQKQYKKLNDLASRKESILQSIEEQGKLTPELKAKILASWDPNEVEDLYLPYKKRKKTKADVARENGLEPLAKIIMSQRATDIFGAASRYLNEKIRSEDEAVSGAKDIIAEWVSEDQSIREMLRNTVRKHGVLVSKVVPKKKDEAEKYKDYFEFSEVLNKCPSHRFLAINRGSNEDLLRMSISIDDDRALQMIENKFIRSHGIEADLISESIEDSYKRLIFPSIETQILNESKEKADDEAIRVFGVNLSQLLMAAPLGQKEVLAIDPGFRTGCKVVCLDSNGGFLEYATIFPHAPQNDVSEATAILKNLVYKYDIKAIAIGNGTASRETESIVAGIRFDSKLEIYVVNESGASIYSASDVAREEFPDKDVTVRGSISIGRRLLDPLAELVKIDAKSIGVGQYQHDVHQNKLKEELDNSVISCVNRVGVNLNTASKHLLTYISGLGPALAQNIVNYRTSNGDFTDIKHLKKVPRLGEKAFEQAAGFLRIRNGKNPLDNTGVHPESYHIVEKMASVAGTDINSFLKTTELKKKINLQDFVTGTTGLPTLQDIIKELEKPGLDPRGQAKAFSFDDNVKKVEDLTVGMTLPGIVTNMTNFGAFVDIGVKQDGLLHISQISKTFIKNPSEVLSLGQELMVRVTEVDPARKRINLTLLGV